MTTEVRPLSFWSTVRLLLRVARRRATGRQRRQQQLLNTRSKNSSDWGQLGFFITVILMLCINGSGAFLVRMAVESGQRVEVERQGKIVVSNDFRTDLGIAEETYHGNVDEMEGALSFAREAKEIANAYGGNPDHIEKKLRDEVREHRVHNLVGKSLATPGMMAVATMGRFPAMVGSFVLLWWMLMLVFQGEGLELDIQRRRHPMWEWLFSHPVSPGAIFLAEMISPIVANPVYWGGPIFVGILHGFVYGTSLGICAAFLVGVPLTVAFACIGKAVEIAVTLRSSARTRGALIGLMSWAGYAAMMLLFLGLFFVPKVVASAAVFLNLLTVLPWPWLRLFLGGHPDGSFSFVAAVVVCWFASTAMIGAAVWFSTWGARQGLAGNSASDTAPSRRVGKTNFGREPLYRKEFLWFVRDRSAIVQTLLIPLTVASFQVFNLRGVLSEAQSTWNYLCGVAILFGTYFLWVLGPKSLTSEGTALWIALTWPRGLENLLKAKAWLWSLISTGMVALVLCYTVYMFPDRLVAILLVGVGWLFFSRSMAEKTVTLVTLTSSSGEQEKVPLGRRWAAQLGMLTFAIGVLSRVWSLAVVGIVYSYVTAAAMWENFRARLPYLYDPWSEKVPPPPTLMHAMVAISILVEAGAVVTGMLAVIAGRDNIAVAQAIGYAISAVVVSLGVGSFLSDRGVDNQDVWLWKPIVQPRSKSTGSRAVTLLVGAGIGIALGIFAHAYMAILEHLPTTAELVRKSQEQIAKIPDLRIAYAVIAVAFAPFAEEYLFRGLLYRALDREWGGWKAIVGSAAFFAIYHPPLSWLPVALLGIANAILFKKTGRLASAVVLHAVYNGVVLFNFG